VKGDQIAEETNSAVTIILSEAKPTPAGESGDLGLQEREEKTFFLHIKLGIRN
jgi:hypothetical protein